LIIITCTNLVTGAGAQARKDLTITLTNTTSIALKDKGIEIKRKDLPKMPAGNFHPLIINHNGDTLAAQLEDLNGDHSWDKLFFVADLKAYKKASFKFRWSDKEPVFTKRTSIRFGVRKNRESKVVPSVADTFYANQLPGVIGYQRYQTDGPTWENDKVGFRQYLDGRNSIDVFGKKISDITPEDVGINEAGVTEPNYSAMQVWGTDILHVGNSVGLGGSALLIGDSIARLGITEQDSLNNVDSTFCHIVTEGPVRSELQVDYRGWKPLNRNYSLEQNTSITPGNYAFKNELLFNNLQGDETLLVGLVNSRTSQKLSEVYIDDNCVVLLTHDKQSVNKEWWLGLAVILPRKNYLGFIEAPKTGIVSSSFFGKLKVENNKPVTYFAVAGWELSDSRFKDPANFKKYVKDLAKQLSAPVTIKIN
jgi:hypothetical protein